MEHLGESSFGEDKTKTKREALTVERQNKRQNAKKRGRVSNLCCFMGRKYVVLSVEVVF